MTIDDAAHGPKHFIAHVAAQAAAAMTGLIFVHLISLIEQTQFAPDLAVDIARGQEARQNPIHGFPFSYAFSI
jgi:hypothetical protein